MDIDEVEDEAREWWRELNQGRLTFQFCAACESAVFYPRARCPVCFAKDLEWRHSKGRGEVYAYTIVRQAPRVDDAHRAPYVVALVDLEEGFRLMTNVVDCDSGAVCVGLPVQLSIRSNPEGVTVPMFVPASNPSSSSAQEKESRE